MHEIFRTRDVGTMDMFGMTAVRKWFGFAGPAEQTASDDRGAPADVVFQRALTYLHGEGVQMDKARAAQLFTRAAESGHTEAQYLLGLMLYEGHVPSRNHPEGVTSFSKQREAARWFGKAAEKGHAGAQARLGIYYLMSGSNVPGSSRSTSQTNEREEARKWLTLAANQGDELAVKYLARIGG